MRAINVNEFDFFPCFIVSQAETEVTEIYYLRTGTPPFC